MAALDEVERWNYKQTPLILTISTGRGLTMTPAAAAHIRDLMHKQPDKQGLRTGIKTSGCAGFGYVLENDCRAGGRRSAV